MAFLHEGDQYVLPPTARGIHHVSIIIIGNFVTKLWLRVKATSAVLIFPSKKGIASLYYKRRLLWNLEYMFALRIR